MRWPVVQADHLPDPIEGVAVNDPYVPSIAGALMTSRVVRLLSCSQPQAWYRWTRRCPSGPSADKFRPFARPWQFGAVP